MTGVVVRELGLLVLAALFLGRLAARLHLPRVTGDLVAGALAGPSLLPLVGLPPLVNRSTVEALRPFTDVALALIVFQVGGHLRLARLRRWGWRVLVLAAGAGLVPAAVVLAACRRM